jgi:hypothetical protein
MEMQRKLIESTEECDGESAEVRVVSRFISENHGP